MANVTFAVNELQASDPDLARDLETEIAAAAERLEPLLVLDCRILVDRDLEGRASRVRVQFERPGWVKSFGVSLKQPLSDVRRAAEGVLGAT
ncbi:MAG: hypothetical protein DMF80_09515 [Acidobacteria bacterium]|nr:MAG: hypothetical protein DMF80_09515 [Acidobacteriota bacterium]PYQ19592.1 MAG: hypothetical protein DMF81_21330 [Acidobacteriota bacterium]